MVIGICEKPSTQHTKSTGLDWSQRLNPAFALLCCWWRLPSQHLLTKASKLYSSRVLRGVVEEDMQAGRCAAIRAACSKFSRPVSEGIWDGCIL